MELKKILLHDIQYTNGGPKTVLNGIVNSYLGKKYEFVRIHQTGGCGFNPIKAFKFVRHYKKLIDAENADVFYVCGLQYTGLLMTLAGKLSNVKKVVFHEREDELVEYKAKANFRTFSSSIWKVILELPFPIYCPKCFVQ